MWICLVLLPKPCSQLRILLQSSFTGEFDPWAWRKKGKGQTPMALSKTGIRYHTKAREYVHLQGCWQETSCSALTSFKLLLYMIYFSQLLLCSIQPQMLFAIF